MTATHRSAERRITAFMENPDNMDVANVIHANQGAREYGYRAALVPGVIAYGWTVPAIIEVFGPGWLEEGWIDLSFRRPVYPADDLVARVVERDEAVCELAVTNQNGEVCISGELRLGRARWLEELKLPRRREAERAPAFRPQLTLDIAPVGHDVRPMAVPVSREEARRFALERERQDEALFTGEEPLLHPGWLAGRMTPLLRHSYSYGPAIHARSQIQNLSRARAGQTVTVAGHLTDAFERKGHHYAVLDGVIISEDGRELARIRHTTIFQVARRGETPQ